MTVILILILNQPPIVGVDDILVVVLLLGSAFKTSAKKSVRIIIMAYQLRY